MATSRHNIGSGRRPFPGARQTQAQRDEDAFMRLHGGVVSRSIYAFVEALSSGGVAAWRGVACVIDLAQKMATAVCAAPIRARAVRRQRCGETGG